MSIENVNHQLTSARVEYIEGYQTALEAKGEIERVHGVLGGLLVTLYNALSVHPETPMNSAQELMGVTKDSFKKGNEQLDSVREGTGTNSLLDEAAAKGEAAYKLFDDPQGEVFGSDAVATLKDDVQKVRDQLSALAETVEQVRGNAFNVGSFLGQVANLGQEAAANISDYQEQVGWQG